jgi:26S proteasome regulatory subunit T2
MGDKGNDGNGNGDKKKREAPTSKTVKRRKKKGAAVSVKIPQVFPSTKCKLRLLRLERVKGNIIKS